MRTVIAGAAMGKRRSAGGGGNTPGDFATNLVLWLKADAIVGKSDGQTITQWDDSSGAGNHATAGNAPTYKVNIAKGGTKPIVRFNGSSNYLNSNAATSGAAQTVIAVFNTSSGGASRTLRGSDIAGGLQFRVDSSNHLQLVKEGTMDLGAGSTAVTTVTFHVATATWEDSSNTCAFRLDGGSRQTATSTENLSAGAITKVGQNGSNNIEFLNGDLCELAAWTRVVPDADIVSMINGLTSKWI